MDKRNAPTCLCLWSVEGTSTGAGADVPACECVHVYSMYTPSLPFSIQHQSRLEKDSGKLMTS